MPTDTDSNNMVYIKKHYTQTLECFIVDKNDAIETFNKMKFFILIFI